MKRGVTEAWSAYVRSDVRSDLKSDRCVYEDL